MIVLAPACKGNALEFSPQETASWRKTVALDCFKNKRELEWVQSIRWNSDGCWCSRSRLTGEIRMLDCSWKLKWDCLCAPHFLCIYFSCNGMICNLHLQCSGAPAFTQLKFYFCGKELWLVYALFKLPENPLHICTGAKHWASWEEDTPLLALEQIWRPGQAPTPSLSSGAVILSVLSGPAVISFTCKVRDGSQATPWPVKPTGSGD